MERETFDGLRAKLTDLLGKDTKTLKNIIEELMVVKKNIDPYAKIIRAIRISRKTKGKG